MMIEKNRIPNFMSTFTATLQISHGNPTISHQREPSPEGGQRPVDTKLDRLPEAVDAANRQQFGIKMATPRQIDA